MKSVVATLGAFHDKPWWWKHLVLNQVLCTLDYVRLVYKGLGSQDIPIIEIPLVMLKVLKHLLSWRRHRYSYVFTFECDLVGLSIAFWQSVTGMRRPKHVILQFIMREKDQTFKSRTKYALMRILFSSVHRVVVSSNLELEYYQNVFNWPRRKLAFIPFHTDPELLYKKLVAEDDFVLAAGRSFRDYDTLLQAISGTNIKLLIVGGSGVIARYSQIENVRIMENIAVSELYDLMLRSCAVIIPLQDRAISTGQSVLLQAMALGKAVIATRTAGTIDYIDHMNDGILVPPRDSRRLREALLLLIKNTELRQSLGNNARSRIMKKSLPQHYAESVRNVLSSTLSDSVI